MILIVTAGVSQPLRHRVPLLSYDLLQHTALSPTLALPISHMAFPVLLPICSYPECFFAPQGLHRTAPPYTLVLYVLLDGFHGDNSPHFRRRLNAVTIFIIVDGISALQSIKSYCD